MAMQTLDRLKDRLCLSFSLGLCSGGSRHGKADMYARDTLSAPFPATVVPTAILRDTICPEDGHTR